MARKQSAMRPTRSNGSEDQSAAAMDLFWFGWRKKRVVSGDPRGQAAGLPYEMHVVCNGSVGM